MPSSLLLYALLRGLRTVEANEYVQQTERSPLTRDTSPPVAEQTPTREANSKSSRRFDEVKAELRERLNKDPHVIRLLECGLLATSENS